MIKENIIPIWTYGLSSTPHITNKVGNMEYLHVTLKVAINQLFKKLGIVDSDSTITLHNSSCKNDNYRLFDLEIVLPNFMKTGNFQNWLVFEYNTRMNLNVDDLDDICVSKRLLITFDKHNNLVLSVNSDYDLHFYNDIDFVEGDEHFDPWYDGDDGNVPSVVLKDYTILTEKAPSFILLNIVHILHSLLKISIHGRMISRNKYIEDYYISDECYYLFNHDLVEGNPPTEKKLLRTLDKVRNELDNRRRN
ncbi:hypothetical protein [Proteus mirabilis]|uniref:hypothetical protein n=1 Tax=Proteus mirabilis TaxID=584 RepID=UPI0034D71AA3